MFNRLVFLLLAAVGLSLVLYGLTRQLDDTSHLADLLPLEATAFVESSDLSNFMQQWPDNIIGKMVSRSYFADFAARLGFDASQSAKLTKALLEAKRRSQVIRSALFTRHTIIALLPGSKAEHADWSEIVSRLIVLQHCPEEKQWVLLLTRLCGPVSSTVTTYYQGERLLTLHFSQGMQVSYFVYNDMVAWSLDAQLLHHCVDQALQRFVFFRTSLGEEVNHTWNSNRTKGFVETFLYVKPEAMTTLFGLAPEWFANAGLPAPHALTFVNEVQGVKQHIIFTAFLDDGQQARFQSAHHLADAQEHAPLGRLTKNTSFALWTNWFQALLLLQSWDSMTDFPLKYMGDDMLSNLKSVTGLEPRKFFDLFGQELALYMDTSPQQGEQYPHILMSMGVALRDPSVIAGLLQNLVSGLQKVHSLSAGIDIVTLVLANGLMQPAFSVTDKYLFMADSSDLVKQVHEKLTQAAASSAENQDGRQPSNFFLFVRTGDMVEWLLPVLKAMYKDLAGHDDNDTHGWIIWHPLVMSTLADLQHIEENRIRIALEHNKFVLEVSSISRK